MNTTEDNRPPEIAERDRQWMRALFPGGNGESHIEQMFCTPETYAQFEMARVELEREDVAYWGGRETKWAKRKHKLAKARERIAHFQAESARWRKSFFDVQQEVSKQCKENESLKASLAEMGARHNALAVKCDRLEKLAAENQEAADVLRLIEENEIAVQPLRMPLMVIRWRASSPKRSIAAATSDTVAKSVKLLIDLSDPKPPRAKAEWQDHSVDATEMVAETVPVAEKQLGPDDVDMGELGIGKRLCSRPASECAAVHQKLEAAERELADLRKDREAWDAVRKYRFMVEVAGRQARVHYFAGPSITHWQDDPRDAVLALKEQLESK